MNKLEAKDRRKYFASLTREGWTMAQIAKKHNVTRQAVSQLLRKAAKEGEIVVKTKKTNYENHPNYVLIVRKKTLQCTVCGAQFFSKTKSKTCGRNCLKKLRSGGKWSHVEKVSLVCTKCNKTFQRSHHQHQISLKVMKNDQKNFYCGRHCFENRCEKVSLICSTCNKDFQIPVGQYQAKIKKNSKKFYCGRSCYENRNI